MTIRFYMSAGISSPLVSHDSDEESILAAFLQADVNSSPQVRQIIRDKIRCVKKGKKKSSYPGNVTTIFISWNEVEIRDNLMLFDEPKTYKCSLEGFKSIFNQWEEFLDSHGM